MPEDDGDYANLHVSIFSLHEVYHEQGKQLEQSNEV